MFKNILAKFRSKKGTEIQIDREIIYCIYRILVDLRYDLVDSFYRIKDRRLREIYDSFAFMMLKYDKVLQFLRRTLNEDLYAKYPRLTPKEIEDLIQKLPLEVASTMRSLVQVTKLLKEFSLSAPPSYIISTIKNLNDVVDDLAKYLDKVIE
jgi:hypothetical protein